MELVDLVCDGENDLQADGALGVLTAWPSAALGSASQGWSWGTGTPRPAGSLWVGLGPPQWKHSIGGAPGPGGSQGLGHPEQVRRKGQGTGGAQVSLCPQRVSQPDRGVGWHGRGVVKAGGSEQVPIGIGVGQVGLQVKVHLRAPPIWPSCPQMGRSSLRPSSASNPQCQRTACQ